MFITGDLDPSAATSAIGLNLGELIITTQELSSHPHSLATFCQIKHRFIVHFYNSNDWERPGNGQFHAT